MTFPTKLARALAAGAWSRPRQPPPPNPPTLRSSRRTSPRVQSMTANFVQTDASGRSAAGTLQLKRPGQVRFEYGSGDLLLVANGKTLSFIDYQVGQKSSWPLGGRRCGAAFGSPDFNGKAEILPSDNARVIVAWQDFGLAIKSGGFESSTAGGVRPSGQLDFWPT